MSKESKTRRTPPAAETQAPKGIERGEAQLVETIKLGDEEEHQVERFLLATISPTITQQGKTMMVRSQIANSQEGTALATAATAEVLWQGIKSGMSPQEVAAMAQGIASGAFQAVMAQLQATQQGKLATPQRPKLVAVEHARRRPPEGLVH